MTEYTEEEKMFETHSSFRKKSSNINENIENIEKIENNRDLLRQPKDNRKYKNEDLIKVHEFRRENIRDPFEEIEPRKFFNFVSEDDPKYKFLDIQYHVRTKLVIKSIYWSFGIGCLFFTHRYYRRQDFFNALKWGCLTWAMSTFAVWGSFELPPFLMALYHSNFLKSLAAQDYNKYKNLGNLKYDENYKQKNERAYGVALLPKTENPTCEFAKSAYDYDNLVLRRFGYKTQKTEKIIKKKEFSEDNLFDEDFDEKSIMKSLKEDTEDFIEYDFSFQKTEKFNENCQISVEKFFELEKNNLGEDKKKVLRDDFLSKKKFLAKKTEELLKDEIINTENFLNGMYKDFNSDPDYKEC